MPVSSRQSDAESLGLYVHWPFCQAICPYCDFNVVRLRTVDESEWLASFDIEMGQLHQIVPERQITSIFFGGGTPSLMSPSLVESLIHKISDRWPLAPDAEITLEANPTDAEAAKFHAFAEAGINRLSLGLQSLNDQDLKTLGRWHSAAEGLVALDRARKAFRNVSIDLIYARQDQSVTDWAGELRHALEQGPDHISLYQLTIEPGTAFERRVQRGDLTIPTEHNSADLYQISQDLCAEYGFAGYEISNHAKPGRQSQHNLTYWRYRDYAGLGPGAHGRLTVNGQKMATSNMRAVKAWLNGLSDGASVWDTFDPLSAYDQAVESLLMGLRLDEGYDVRRFERLGDLSLPVDEIEQLCADDLLHQDGSIIRATNRGRIVLDGILKVLIPQNPGL